ncbi:hypothetical protein D3C76_1604880 [compost metagenome]
MPIILQVWFWFTPIVYSVNIIPDYIKGSLAANPMYPIVTAYHDVLVYDRTPDLNEAGMITVVALVLMVIGLFMFRRASAEMVDSL